MRLVQVPVSELEDNAQAVLAQLRAERTPVLITQQGAAPVVLLDVETFGAMVDRLAILETILKGEQAFTERASRDHIDVKTRPGMRG